MLKRELLDILCCPKCKNDLDYRPAENTLTCTRCATVYPVRNDIPILTRGSSGPAHTPGSGHDARD